MTKEVKIMLAIAAVVVVGGIVLFSSQPKPETPGAPVGSASFVRDSSHMTGKKDAKVQVVEFGDYECPACGAAAPILSRLRQEYTSNADVNFVFRHFPLPQHSKAIVAAEAAEAAGEQGKYFEMTDKIYETQNLWTGAGDHKAVFINIAKNLGLNVDTFSKDLDKHTYDEIINTDKADGTSLGVNSTPTFFINGEKMPSFQYEALRAKIEEKLK